jgi:hypothetical protein
MKRRLNYVWDKIFDELTASVTFSHESETSQIVQFSPFDLRTIPRRFLWKKIQTENRLVIHITTITTEKTKRFRLVD